MRMISYILILIACVSSTPGKAEVGLEEVNLYHKSVIQVSQDLELWLKESRSGLQASKKSSAYRACLATNKLPSCEEAIEDLLPFSVIPLKDSKIFELERQLKQTGFEFEVGVKIFKLSSALRFFVKQEIYNGVPAPEKISAKNISSFVSAIENFHSNKSIDLKKGRAMIPPLTNTQTTSTPPSEKETILPSVELSNNPG